jgi:hypothetical protein
VTFEPVPAAMDARRDVLAEFWSDLWTPVPELYDPSKSVVPFAEEDLHPLHIGFHDTRGAQPN